MPIVRASELINDDYKWIVDIDLENSYTLTNLCELYQKKFRWCRDFLDTKISWK